MYQVFGYDDECVKFSYTLNSFVQAVATFLRLDNGMRVVFINGVSDRVAVKLTLH